MLISMVGVLFAQGDQPTPAIDDGARFSGYLGIAPWSIAMIDAPVPLLSPACGVLDDGSGSGFFFGLAYEGEEILPSLRLHLGLIAEHTTGELIHFGTPFPIRNSEGAVIDGRVDQRVDVTATDVIALPGLSYDPLARLRFTFGLGAMLRFHANQELIEVAVAPDDLLLVNNAREMKMTEGALLPLRSIVPLGFAHLRYDLPLGPRSTASPMLGIAFPLISENEDGELRPVRFHLGVAIGFGLKGETVLPDPPDSITPPPVLVADVRTDPEVVQVDITEYDSIEAVPLLNRVFFDRDSSVIPERYIRRSLQETVTFTTKQLQGPVLEVYRELLNIIGSRLSQYPGATLRIVGHHSGEEQIQGLDRRRAESVRDYLVEVWDVPLERLKVEGGGPPTKPVPERSREGREENAMVELIASDLSVIAPLPREYTQRVATPPSVTFFPRAISEAGLAGWELRVIEGDNVWRHFRGEGALPDSIVWSWESDSGSLPSLPIRLSYALYLTDSAGQSTRSPLTPINVQVRTKHDRLVQREQDTIIEHYSLLLFDYDSPEVSPGDRALLRAIAETRIQPGAVVRFIGFTDSLGDAERNRRLAHDRAARSAEVFAKYAPEGVQIIVSDLGGERESHPFDTPEGRAYSRTVAIEVRQPDPRPAE